MKRRVSGQTVTIKDVALTAGVSVATVSYVLTGNRRVKESTRERIQAAMRRLGYRRNRVAGALRARRTYTLGLLVPDITNPYFPDLVQGAERAAAEKGYGVLLCDSRMDWDWTRRYIEFMLEHRVEGISLAQGVTAEIARLLEQARVPTCLCSTQAPDFSCSSVEIDFCAGMRQALEHLFHLGHRLIGCVGTRLEYNCPRLHSFLKVMAEFGLPAEKFQLIETELLQPQDAEGIVQQLRSSPRPPTALVGANDILSLEIISVARQAGLKVPEDLSVIGTDDILLASRSSPALSTLAFPRFEMGATAIRVLLEYPTKGPQHVVFTPNLVVRQSSGPAPKK